jgi:cellobiose-specific phosphotransferase system component IIC
MGVKVVVACSEVLSYHVWRNWTKPRNLSIRIISIMVYFHFFASKARRETSGSLGCLKISVFWDVQRVASYKFTDVSEMFTAFIMSAITHCLDDGGRKRL